ncbi:tRNA (5-methylaminomethyl-2-thiouridine)(34)-methyltransferase MnmD [Aurantibacter crassamenti]|uniref:tRNA (5-methylaminomethyl-2-thiouridine)(34)-methyltransferase MnmD n=1 Tax=Aurantibacter crassamenti TaxID=1837375 RepID=UPI001939DA19|nr:tRNA (5-methylaminomethyl-2-thiouridine)(34)-methyltransferase MnmD [Aurantibacter crassamenti]MBM1106354.1 tRNA (5-methylaminomethyl-2-thiouridine)(34)-methyltransferase MnmD [Aurantibacter crassamenti]
MNRKVIITSDGSKTIQIEDLNEQYHSIHGAVQEAEHVFIKNGLSLFKEQEISILEIGFGTGLNALITLIRSKEYDIKVKYTGVEKFPVVKNELDQLNYISCLDAINFQSEFNKMHNAAWETDIELSKDFILKKREEDFLDIKDVSAFDLVYFDAFGARVQPELWTEIIFKKMYDAMKTDAFLVTYSAKGSVRRAMQAVGFEVERLPGPPGKREMLRAKKLK